MEIKIFDVEGMKCEHCEAAVEEALKNLDGVTRARADRQRHSVEVDYEAGRVTPQQMKDAVEAAGSFELTL